MRSVFKRLANFDKKFSDSTTRLIAGVDEVGRGPLAGPVVAGAVIFIRPANLPELNDSKQVPHEIRRKLFYAIAENALVGIGKADEREIEILNIYHASRLAMRRAVLALTRTPDFLLIDGKMKLDLPLPQQAIIEGDAKSAAIAAASIIAKVVRDEWMAHLDEIYPAYGFKQHKGYATPDHLRLLRENGPSPVHRKGFQPVDALQENAYFETQPA